MKNKRLLAILAITTAASFLLSACDITGDKPEEQVIVADDAEPTPEPTKEPEPTEEPEPVWEPVYTSEDGSISINLPNETWSNKTDENGIISFESEQGKIVIVHGEGDDLDTLVLPDSEDMAATLVRAKEIEDGEFEISGFANDDLSGVGVIYYTVKYSNTEKTEGVAQEIIEYISSENEYYEITAEINAGSEAAANDVANAVDSFKINTDSPLSSGAALMHNAEVPAAAEGEEAADGELVDAEPADGTEPVSTGSYSDDDLSDTSRTRTIYSNDGNGTPIVISNNGDGTWSDSFGRTFRFDSADESIVYDGDDVDYYYGGEAGDVAYMPIVYEE